MTGFLELIFVLAILGGVLWAILVGIVLLKRVFFGKGTPKPPKPRVNTTPPPRHSTPTHAEKWEKIARNINKVRDRDPIRFFYETELSDYIYSRAGNRCEHTEGKVRCAITEGLQLDHIYPWYHGGWTILSNAQVLCREHNREKGAKIPSSSELYAIALRRIVAFSVKDTGDNAATVRWKPDELERAHREEWLKTNEAHVPPIPDNFQG